MVARSSRDGVEPRQTAVRVLTRIERDGAFAAAALAAELVRDGMDARERGLVTELVYGVVRTRGALLDALKRYAPKGVSDPSVRLVLLVGAYQLLFLDRVPTHAAVDVAVTQVRRLRGARVAGFVNAVLRRVAAERGKLSLAQAVESSVPTWLLDQLRLAVGAEQSLALLGVDPEAPERFTRARSALRLNGEPTPELLAATEPARHVSAARYLKGGNPSELPGFDEGAFMVQEEGAQLVALALEAREQDSLLDACAGRGQKTVILRQRFGAEARLMATDCHEHKLRQLHEQFAKLSLLPPTTHPFDWAKAAGPAPGGAAFDAVLVDAPCTGVGTLRRRPELAFRLQQDDPARLGRLAASILRQAALATRIGGALTFAVCSVLECESEEVVAAVSDLLVPRPFSSPEICRLAEPGASTLRLLPGRHGTDGYFIANLRRV